MSRSATTPVMPQHPVGQRRLAVVDVGDDAEVPNLRRRSEGLVGETADGNLLVGRRQQACASPGYRAGARPTQSRTSPSLMLGIMAPQWKTFQRFAENLVFNEAPKFIRQLQKSDDRAARHSAGHQARPRRRSQRARGRLERDAAGDHRRTPGHREQRPDRAPGPQARLRARPRRPGRPRRDRLDLGGLRGRPDARQGPPGAGGRPRQHHAARADAVQPGPPPRPTATGSGIGSGSWDYEGRASWVRLDRVLDVPEEGIRREGAILDRETVRGRRDRGCGPSTPGATTPAARRRHIGPHRCGPPSGSVISPVISKPNRW